MAMPPMQELRPLVYINMFHDYHDNDSFDCLIVEAYIMNQAVNQSDRTYQRITILKKEIIMRAHGQATVWGAHVGVGRARGGASWYQQLRDWWQAHKTARQQARHTALNACWDAERETVRPLRAEAAPDIVAAQGAFSVATQLYGLTL
jgi:hypothetical protein